MVPMIAKVGFSDRALATEFNTSGAQAPHVPFEAPSADEADRLEAAGLAERAKSENPAASAKTPAKEN